MRITLLHNSLKNQFKSLSIGLFTGGLATVFTAIPLSVLANPCAQIQCDCSVFEQADWRDQCLAREVSVKADCEANQGQPKSFCTLQGPAAFPTALSGRPLKLVSAEKDKKVLLKALAAQLWSFEDSLRSTQERESSGEIIQAVQASKILDQEAARLKDLYIQNKSTLGTKDLVLVADKMQTVADQTQQFATKLADKSKDQTAKKTLYLDLAFRLMRSAGTLNEYSADLYSLGQQSESAAQHWQKAAELSHLLLTWEKNGQNRAQHLALYRELESARWYRATLNWLSVGNNQAISEANQKAVRALQEPSLVAESGDAAFVREL